MTKCLACSSDVLFYSDAACQSAEPSSVRARCETCYAIYSVRMENGALALRALQSPRPQES